MPSKTNNSVTNLFENAPRLKDLIAKVEQIEKTQQLIITHLDPAMAENCKVANLENGILSLATISPEWKHSLRFHSSSLLSTLRNQPELTGLKSIKIQVDPLLFYQHLPAVSKSAQTEGPTPISEKNSAIIQNLAATVPDKKLAAALYRLAKHQQR